MFILDDKRWLAMCGEFCMQLYREYTENIVLRAPTLQVITGLYFVCQENR